MVWHASHLPPLSMWRSASILSAAKEVVADKAKTKMETTVFNMINLGRSPLARHLLVKKNLLKSLLPVLFAGSCASCNSSEYACFGVVGSTLVDVAPHRTLIHRRCTNVESGCRTDQEPDRVCFSSGRPECSEWLGRVQLRSMGLHRLDEK